MSLREGALSLLNKSGCWPHEFFIAGDNNIHDSTKPYVDIKPDVDMLYKDIVLVLAMEHGVIVSLRHLKRI